MHRYGKVFLTRHKFMLGEVKSLLQKALRRKENYALQATKELTWKKDASDQLKWKSLLTFLFEDHCLSGSDVLSLAIQLHAEKNKRGFVEMLLKHCKTCRVAACLPVITLSDKYFPADFDKTLHMNMDTEIGGLVEEKDGCFNFDLILALLQQSWKSRNIEKIMTWMKLISSCYDLEKRTLTQKGKQFLLEKSRGKPHVGQITLRMLYLETKDLQLKKYIGNCYKLASITDSPVRLILFSVVTHLLFQHEVKSVESLQLGTIDWKSVGILQNMPDWAVDKHTFRGKYGKASKQILQKRPEGMSDEMFEEFHGTRRKSDQKDFFTVGVEHVEKAIPHNPFWTRTMQIYFQHKPKQQKTLLMTMKFMEDLKKEVPELFHSCGEKTSVQLQKQVKRKLPAGEEKEVKKRKVEEMQFVPPPDCPLLQIPNGPNKTYTRVDINEELVWKGPLSKKKRDRILFVHSFLRSVFDDSHTLDVSERPPYVVFPLVKGSNASLTSEKKVFVNYLEKKQVQQAKIMSRKSVGIQQLHELSSSEIWNLPMSVWAHFLFRFVLNVGDSGLYNAIADTDCNFVYGIDMEENRGKKPSPNLLDIMFVKKPSQPLCYAILHSIKKKKVPTATLR